MRWGLTIIQAVLLTAVGWVGWGAYQYGELGSIEAKLAIAVNLLVVLLSEAYFRYLKWSSISSKAINKSSTKPTDIIMKTQQEPTSSTTTFDPRISSGTGYPPTPQTGDGKMTGEDEPLRVPPSRIRFSPQTSTKSPFHAPESDFIKYDDSDADSIPKVPSRAHDRVNQLQRSIEDALKDVLKERDERQKRVNDYKILVGEEMDRINALDEERTRLQTILRQIVSE